MTKNWQIVFQVILSILTFGVTWAINNQAAVVTAAAIIIVYLINAFAKLRNVKLGSGWLTVILYIVAMVLAYFFNPTALPAFGPVPSDPALLINAVLAYIPLLIAMLTPYAGAAMAIYNMLAKSILDQTASKLLSG